MSKNCIFNNKKICNDCGDCEVCELNSNKKCDNCGKCLELEGFDVKAIKIDEVFENAGTGKLDDDIYNVDKIDEPALEEGTIDNKVEETSKDEEASKIKAYEAFLAEEKQEKLNKDKYIPENNEVWEFIDDIDGAKELLEDEEDNSEFLKEEFPGLIRLKKV
ncbi:hypothetical protein KPL37_12835 [Clostridium frigoris]|uniref:Protein containing Zn-finger domain n=1 Tax=Clostridium frigoris TaxID=205327 RepID=A0ABS6BWS6_9CLOT|nr:hypothetical protein [Clostridium frigoris]MBU3160632.1 hypothetical protein [Clostridium frigoris]